MEDELYDTSWTVHCIPQLSSALAALLLMPSETKQTRQQQALQLSAHAEALRDSLLGRDRPRYEREDEREKLGGLRACTWTRLDGLTTVHDHWTVSRPLDGGRHRKEGTDQAEETVDRQERGLIISLLYDKTTYKFVVYTTTNRPASNANKRGRQDPPPRVLRAATSSTNIETEAAILLSKSSPSALKCLLNYLSDTFAVTADAGPLRFPSTLVQSTLEIYLSTICTVSLEHLTGDPRENLVLKHTLLGTVNTVKVCLAFSAPVAPNLKSLEVTVSPQMVIESFRRAEPGKKGPEDALRRGRAPLSEQIGEDDHQKTPFMGMLALWVWGQTGLHLPVGDERKTDVSKPASEDNLALTEPPMRLSRISNAAYAMSCDGRLKFVSRALGAAEALAFDCAGVDDIDYDGDGSFTRDWLAKANTTLLAAVVQEARRQVREERG